MGRPPKDPSEVRKDVVRFPVTADEKQVIEQAAEILGLTVSEFARQKILKPATDVVAKQKGKRAGQ